MKTLSAGKYVIADPYKVMDRVSANRLMNEYFKSGVESDIVIFEAEYGSGIYSSNSFGNVVTNSDHIGIFPENMCNKEMLDKATLYESVITTVKESTFNCKYESFFMHFGDVEVDVSWAYEFFK